MSSVRCPTCERQFETAESTAMPFCSDRCRQIDLGRWLGEKFSVPVTRDREDAPESGDDGESE